MQISRYYPVEASNPFTLYVYTVPSGEIVRSYLATHDGKTDVDAEFVMENVYTNRTYVLS